MQKRATKTAAVQDPRAVANEVLAWLERRGSKKNRDGMARYAIVAPKVFGVSVGDLREKGKDLGRSHELAMALWASGWYEARMLVPFVGEPDRVTPAQMDRWCRDFDNWAVCDALCFHLFDRTPHAYDKVAQWATRRDEFQKRAAFALAASLAGHDKAAPDVNFERILPLIERAADDDRNFVKKGVSWALRGIGMRSPNLHAASIALARRLADAPSPSARWIGRDALRDLTRPLVIRRVQARGKQARRAAVP
jgi:3-methyladenine DNA glycosylase AlkD